MEIIQLFSKMSSANLEIKNLSVVILPKKDGVVIQLTSSDPDGVKMSNLLGEMITEMAKMMKKQDPEANVSVQILPMSED